MRRIFWGFCRNWFLMSPLHYLSNHSDFGFEFPEIFVFEKTTPRYHRYGGSTEWLSVSVIRGVGDSPTQWYGELATPRITDKRSWRLPASPIRRVGYWIFKKKTLSIDDTESRRLPAPVIRWVTDSSNCWVRESPTPRITDTLSHSAYRWVGELMTPWIGDTGSRYSKKKLIWCPFSELLTAKPCH